MLLSRRLPLASLVDLCRSMRHCLGAGLSLLDVFRQQARKGTPAVRPVAERIRTELEAGNGLEEALKHERDHFPPLFVSLATVGEQTGMLPEICRELERYFAFQMSLKRQFLSMIAWPVIQLVAGIFVIAGLIFILGLVVDAKDFDPIGLGTGPGPALGFLVGAFGSIGLLGVVYTVARRTLRAGLVDGLVLRLWVVGPAVRALAITRFCLALRLTLETAMSIKKALRLSFAATGNGAYEAAGEAATEDVMKGKELSVALKRTGLFPEEFGHIIAVGEESGRLTEVLEQQGEQYQEESQRRLKALAATAGAVIWLLIAALIIIAIFRIALTYIGMLDPARYGL